MSIRDFSNFPDNMVPDWVMLSRNRARDIAVRRIEFLRYQNSKEARAESAAISERLNAQGIYGASDSKEARQIQKALWSKKS